MDKPLEVLKSILGAFFKDEFYTDGVEHLRIALSERQYYQESWTEVIKFVILNKLGHDEPLYLMDNYANVPLHENSNEEAYRWLILMIINGGKNVGESILNYEDFLNPENVNTK
ncbi:MAG: hypothetical protein U5M51_00945 [Emticicia sp.]|nr:hypothetical protein [Emticicia sp.]